VDKRTHGSTDVATGKRLEQFPDMKYKCVGERWCEYKSCRLSWRFLSKLQKFIWLQLLSLWSIKQVYSWSDYM